MFEESDNVAASVPVRPLTSVLATETPGVSIVICCHNSARLLPPTIEHLRRQRVSSGQKWEVIVIDNASTDDTGAVAARCWGNDPIAPMRVVVEPKLGLSHARARAFDEAQYEIVSFVDDDNWVGDSWVASVAAAFANDPKLGALGALVYPTYESLPPHWWYDYAEDYFALLMDSPRDPIYLKGAGMAVRKTAWQELHASGFQSFLTGRKGASLTCGEDTEITHALYLRGWKLRVDDRLRLLHFMPAGRLEWSYLRRLVRSSSASLALTDAYFAAGRTRELPANLRSPWWRIVAHSVMRRLRHPRPMLAWMFSRETGDRRVLEQEQELGWLIGLIKFRRQFAQLAAQANR
jgi:glycosyltransferase involved in cell wall biosynthesis